MAMTKIEVMSSRKLLGIAILATGLQVIFFIIPFYSTPESVSIIHLKADKYSSSIQYEYDEKICSVEDRYLANNAKRASFDKSTDKKLFHRFVFRLPRIHNGSSPVDHSKWHSKVTGLLTVSKSDRIDKSLYTRWYATLFACKDNSKKLYKYGPSSFKVKLNESISEYHKPTIIKYSTTLLEFEPIGHDEYTLVIESKSVDPQEYSLLEMSLMLTIPNVAFSRFMVYLKTIFFALALLFIIWCKLKLYKNAGAFNNRTSFATFVLGIALLCLNMPVEWFTLLGSSDFLLYTKDVRTDIYYAVLAISCLIFICECIAQNNLAGLRIDKRYLMSIILIILEWCALMILHIYQNSIDINVFFKTRPSSVENGLFIAFFVTIVIVAVMYTIYLTFMIGKALPKEAGSSGPPSASHRRSHRSIFPLMSTLICVLVTLIEFVFCEICRYQTRLNEGKIVTEPPSLSVGVFSMWNFYTLMMIYFYAPERHEESAPTPFAPPPSAPPPSAPMELIPISELTLPPIETTIATFPADPDVLPPSYDELLHSVNANNAAEGSNGVKKSKEGAGNIY